MKEQQEGSNLTSILNRKFIFFFLSALFLTTSIKGYGLALIKHVFMQLKAAKKRAANEKKNYHVPPFLIYSVTQKCNLNCKGCYSKSLHNDQRTELSIERVDHLFQEAQEIGTSVIMLAGGEPLLRKEIVESAGKYPDIIFPLFTNGMLLTDQMAKDIKRSRNLFPIISIEGDEEKTNHRRGQGIYSHILDTFKILRNNNVLFGVSITVTKSNFEYILQNIFIDSLKQHGVKIIFFVEYIPCQEGTDDLVISSEQRLLMKKLLKRIKKRKKVIIVSFPGDEEAFGGCLAAGRGFVHIGSDGRLEPCPFSPYSDSTLSQMSLTDALKSNLLKSIRDNHEKLSEHTAGCALWENREWVEEIRGKKQS